MFGCFETVKYTQRTFSSVFRPFWIFKISAVVQRLGGATRWCSLLIVVWQALRHTRTHTTHTHTHTHHTKICTIPSLSPKFSVYFWERRACRFVAPPPDLNHEERLLTELSFPDSIQMVPYKLLTYKISPVSTETTRIDLQKKADFVVDVFQNLCSTVHILKSQNGYIRYTEH